VSAFSGNAPLGTFACSPRVDVGPHRATIPAL